MLQKLFCHISNAKTQILVQLDRPEQLEIKLNDVVIADRGNFPREKGVFVVTRFLSGQQTLKSFQKGLPTSNIALRVIRYLQVNEAPIARFDFNSLGDVEPSLVSFSALLSSDPDGSIVSYEWDFGDQSFATGAVVDHVFRAAGSYNVTLKVTDNRGAQNSTTKALIIKVDTFGPILSQINPPANSQIEANSLVLTGESNEPLSRVLVQVNTQPAVEATINGSHFSANLLFSSHGAKNIKITAFDLKNNQSITNISYSITFNSPPLARINILSQSSGIAPSMLWFDGSTSSDQDGDQLTYLWDFGDDQTSLEAKPTHLFKVAGTHTVTLTVRDSFGGESSITKNITLESPVLPVDPATVAPPLSPDLLQTNEEKFGFLFQGADAVQKDVDLTKIEEKRITPIKGKILKDAATPLEAVHVSVKDHPEFGHTLTRSDGAWDLVVNGGGVLTIIFKKGGFANSLRQIDTANNTPNTIDDVLLVQIDEKKTIVQLNTATPQVHESTIVQDQDGVRRAQVLIPENTTAEIVMPDGSRRPVEQLTIRATEFSFGVDGQKRMPAALPPRSGYTYAADFTADEAIALGADSVEFSKPVPIYVDNFLNFPVGIAVPVGFLNPKSGYWEQMPDGIVLKVLSVNPEQKAQLDMHGTGVVVTPAELSLLNITDSELKVIAQKFQVGQSFWRAVSQHFSVIDLNANALRNEIEPLPDDKKEKCDPCGNVAGCIINVPRQLLDEEINLSGLGYGLRYSTDRVSGRKIPYTIAIDPINTYTLNADKQPLISAKVTVKIAGQVFVQEFNNPQITDKFEYAWNGLDGFGRPVFESQTAKVSIEYLYPDTYSLYNWAPGIYSFDTLNSNINVVLNSARAEYVLTNSFDSLVSSPLDKFRTKALKQFNGWSLNNYHSYDTKQKTLYKGTGETIQTGSITSVVSTIAGNGVANSLGNFGLAVNASLNLPLAVTKDALGNIFVAEAQGHQIRKIDLNGLITRVAGNGSSANTGDGGLAINAAIGSPRAIRVAEDGTIYFNDFLNHVTRKIDPAGIISTIAGTGIAGYSGDGGPATQAQMNGPRGLVIGKDGSIYVSDSRNNVLRRIWTDGKITTYAGTGSAGFAGDNGPATEAELNFPNFTDIDEQGNIFVADTTNNRIRKISVTGIITTVGGNGISNGPSADFQLATNVSLNNPSTVKVNSRGEIYYSEQGGNRIRKIDENGIVRTVVGTGAAGFNGDGQVGLATLIAEPRGFILNPDDSIIFTDAANHRVRRFGNALSGLFPARIPSSDGSEIYFFNFQGLHEKTFFADTGAVKYEFIHGDGNLLNAVKDAFQRTLTIQRDSQGNLQSMTGPNGQIYQFSVDQNNYLSGVTDPLNNTHSMTYTSDGLLLSFTRPAGNTSTYEFDASGRLTKATEPNGGYKVLTRLADDSVELRTSENIISKFKTETVNDIPEFTHYQEDGGIFKSLNFTQFGFTRQTTAANVQIDTQLLTDLRFAGFSTYQGSANKKYTTLNDAVYLSYAAKNYIFSSDGVNFIRNSGASDNAGFSMNSTFDSASKTITATTGAGRSTFATISSQEKLTSLKLGNNFLATNFSYDTQGRLSEISQGDRLTKLSYDQFGFLNQIVDPESRVTRFINDAIGRTLKTISPDLNETKIDYDRNSNITGITPPQRLLHQFVNNTIDFLASYTAPDSTGSRTFQYDSDKRLRSIASEENSPININFGNIDGNENNNKITGLSLPNFSINYQHHPDFKWLAVAESTDQVKITYDRRGDDILFSKSYNGQFSSHISYAYNPTGLMQTSETINAVQLNQSFNSDKLLIQNGNLNIGRDASTGLPSSKTLGNRSELISYNQYGEIASRHYQLNNVTNYSETYTRDKLGRITNKAIFRNNVTNNQSFQYDLKGRLLTISINGVLRNTFTYDAQGNRLSSSATNYFALYSSRDRLTEFTNNSKRTTFTYSEDDQHIVKNEIDDNTITTYYISGLNALQKVKIVSPTGTKTITYFIDGENKRSAKLVDGVIDTFFIYDKYQRLVAELNPDFLVRSRFVYGTQSHSPDYMIKNNEELFFVKDQLGSILQVVNSSGVVRQELQYNLFGAVQSDSNRGFQPFGFAGGHYDWETRLVRFGARDYDAEMGRWLVRDPIGFEGGDSNLYAYAGNDPINRIDPSGTFAPALCLWPVYTGVTGAVFSALGTALAGGSPTEIRDSAIIGGIGAAAAGLTVVAVGPTLVGGAIGAAVDLLVTAGLNAEPITGLGLGGGNTGFSGFAE